MIHQEPQFQLKIFFTVSNAYYWSNCDIFTVENVQNIFMEHDLYPNYFWHKRKINNFDPYNVLLAIASNIPQWLNCGPGLQICMYIHNR